jgi:hypothetical protein
MAGSLIQVATNTVTSAVSSVDLIGTTTNDVYMVAISGLSCTDDSYPLYLRFTESGTANSSSNYDIAYRQFKSDTSFANASGQNMSIIDLSFASGNDTGEDISAIMYIYNANDSGEYTFCSFEDMWMVSTPKFWGRAGGGVLTVDSQVDGVSFFFGSSKTIASGTFTLYKVV